MSTKKQAQPADLPTKTKSTYVRPSRAKSAIAARAAAKVAAAEITGDWTPVNDRQAKLAAQATDLGNRAGAIATNQRVAYDNLTRMLDQEIEAAVAALDVDPEVVRSLAEVGLGPDPFGFDDLPADINARASIADEFAEAVTDSTWDFMKDEEVRSAAAYEEAALAKLNHKMAPHHGDGVLSTALTYYDRVLELEAELKTSETVLTESMARAKELARSAEVDRGTIRRLDAKIAELEAIAAGKQDAVNGLAEALATKSEELRKQSARVIELGSELDTAEDRIGQLEQSLAHAQRGLLARIKGVFVTPIGKGAH